MAYGLRAKIAPGVELHDIHIHLAPDRPPEVRLEGTTRHTKTNRVVGKVTIDTVVLGVAGVNFINEIKEAFGGQVAPPMPAVRKEPDERAPPASVGREQPAGE